MRQPALERWLPLDRLELDVPLRDLAREDAVLSQSGVLAVGVGAERFEATGEGVAPALGAEGGRVDAVPAKKGT